MKYSGPKSSKKFTALFLRSASMRSSKAIYSIG